MDKIKRLGWERQTSIHDTECGALQRATESPIKLVQPGPEATRNSYFHRRSSVGLPTFDTDTEHENEEDDDDTSDCAPVR